MLYLLDANVLITAHNLYYPVDAVPEFWAWLAHMGTIGQIKMPLETFEEVKDGGNDTERDHLFAWVQADENKAAILLDEEVRLDLLQRVLNEGYSPDLTDIQVEQVGRDPFLIAYALASPIDRCVVTTEVSSPRKQPQNRRVPDACTRVGVLCCDTFMMLRSLRFSTRWKS